MIYLACIVAYLLLLAGIGIRQSRRVKSSEDFTVAGRSLTPWVMVCTMLAVWIGTGSIVGNAEQTYKMGMATLILPVGTFFGMVLLSLMFADATGFFRKAMYAFTIYGSSITPTLVSAIVWKRAT